MEETILFIDRKNILTDTYEELNNKDIKDRSIKIVYKNEVKNDDYDDVGLKDWLSRISEIIKESDAFTFDSSGNSYIVMDKSDYDSDRIYILAGQILGIAFNNNERLDIKFSSILWKLVLDKDLSLDDLEYFDYYAYDTLKNVEEKDASSMNLTFVDYNEDELIKNGKNIQVTNENKGKYIELMYNRIIYNGVDVDKLDLVKNAFESVVSFSKYKDKNADDIMDQINGEEIVDVDDLIENIEYDSQDKEYVDLFFRIIKKWSNKNLKKIIKFITGSSAVPVKGFAYLEKSIKIMITDNNTNLYPMASTSTNTIFFSKYLSYDEFEEKLFSAINEEDFELNYISGTV